MLSKKKNLQRKRKRKTQVIEMLSLNQWTEDDYHLVVDVTMSKDQAFNT